MPFFKFQNIKIAAISTAVPKAVVKLSSFVEQFGEEFVKKFQETTGVKEFRKTSEQQTASDLCFIAAENILNKRAIAREKIGALIFIAHSTDYRRPATACVLHKRLKLDNNCVAYDINLGCSAFVYGLQSICSLMQSSDIDSALLLVGETMTKMINPLDKSLCMLFGDAGSAILLEKDANAEPITGLLKTDGNGYQAIIAPAGGFRNLNASHADFVWEDGNVRNMYNTIMQGENVFSFTISAIPKTIQEYLSKTETHVDDYDCLAFHQANQFITKMLAKKLKTDIAKLPLSLDRYGNTSASAIPLVLSDKYGNVDNTESLNVLMCGFGVGLSWGVCSAHINVADIYPIIETEEVFEEGIINSPSDFIR
jgi:3-oxoacyl-[acyl-carrier-protein] synthase-3